MLIEECCNVNKTHTSTYKYIRIKQGHSSSMCDTINLLFPRFSSRSEQGSNGSDGGSVGSVGGGRRQATDPHSR